MVLTVTRTAHTAAAGVVAVLLTLGAASTAAAELFRAPDGAPNVAPGSGRDESRTALEPRRPHAKTPLRAPQPPDDGAAVAQGVQADPKYRLVVKFRDGVRARAEAGGLASRAGLRLDPVRRVAGEFGLSFSPLIQLRSDLLEDLERRAAASSRRAQPDLQGILMVTLADPTVARMMAAGNALQTLDEVEYAYLEPLAVPPPGDFPPVTPNLVSHQSYRGPNPGLDFDYAWSVGARGAGIRLADVEYDWRRSHEDLIDANLHSEPGQTPDSPFGDDHGTAVLGMTSAPNNGYGVSGLVPEAAVHTYTEWSVERGSRRVEAVTRAITDSGAGDVVLLEMQASLGGDSKYGPAELQQAVWDVVRVGTDAGVIIVAAAGNGAQDLDGPAYAEYRNRGDSGAIIVGAGSPDTRRDRLSFSTFGSRVNVQGWGDAVFTLGNGDFAWYGGDANQKYTRSFSGTSSASPMVAAACIALQQVVIRQRGWPLSPAALRCLLILTGRPQGVGGHIGPLPNMRRAIDESPNDAPTITFEAASGSMAEAGTASVTVRITTPGGGPLAVAASTQYAPAGGSAAVGSDFTLAPGRLMFVAGTPSGTIQTILVPIANDGLDEDDETFVVALSSPTNAKLATTLHTVTILDDDPVPSLSVADASVREGQSGTTSLTFTVSLSAPSGRTVSAVYALADSSARAGSDYHGASGIVRLTPGSQSQTISVPVVGDTLDENNEALVLTLSTPVSTTLDRAVAQGTILDDDGWPATCQPIALLPATITQSGSFCLTQDLAFPATAGNAITIETDDVVLDLAGFRLTGSAAGSGTQANGIWGRNRKNLTIRHGMVEGFYRGIILKDSTVDNSASNGHLIEAVSLVANQGTGIFVEGRGSVVRRSLVVNTGGTTVLGANADVYGIRMVGPGIRILDNEVRDTAGVGTGAAFAVHVANGHGAVVERNRLGGLAVSGSCGVKLLSTSNALVVGNRLSILGFGIHFVASTGKYRDNLASGVSNPYIGGTDAGNNH